MKFATKKHFRLGKHKQIKMQQITCDGNILDEETISIVAIYKFHQNFMNIDQNLNSNGSVSNKLLN